MKFTDQQLYQLYVGLGVHYKECTERTPKMTSDAIAMELTAGVRASLESRYGDNSLQHLPDAEKLKAYQVLDTFLNVSPLFRAEPVEARRRTFDDLLRAGNVTIIVNNYQGRRHFSDDSFFTGYMYGSMYRPWYHIGRGNFNGGNHHSHAKKADGSVLAALAVVALGAVAVASAFIALYYLVGEIANSVDRFWHNEGWLRAGVSLMGMAIGAVATSMLATAFAEGPLLSLALAAGIASPAGVVGLIITCITLVGAATGSLLFNALKTKSDEIAKASALYPSDPDRFALTPDEEARLVAKGLDVVTVKCAIAALRQDMGKKPDLNRLFGDAHARECLAKIRLLRKGELTSLVVGTGPSSIKFDGFAADTSAVSQYYMPRAIAVPPPRAVAVPPPQSVYAPAAPGVPDSSSDFWKPVGAGAPSAPLENDAYLRGGFYSSGYRS